MLALLRIINIKAGTISIDGQDIAKLSLDELRSSLNVIAQDPYLGADTFRCILTAETETYIPDEEVVDSLTAVGLWPQVQLRGGLDVQYEAKEWSAGERQMLCLCRAMLRKGKLLLLDEATSRSVWHP